MADSKDAAKLATLKSEVARLETEKKTLDARLKEGGKSVEAGMTPQEKHRLEIAKPKALKAPSAISPSQPDGAQDQEAALRAAMEARNAALEERIKQPAMATVQTQAVDPGAQLKKEIDFQEKQIAYLEGYIRIAERIAGISAQKETKVTELPPNEPTAVSQAPESSDEMRSMLIPPPPPAPVPPPPPPPSFVPPPPFMSPPSFSAGTAKRRESSQPIKNGSNVAGGNDALLEQIQSFAKGKLRSVEQVQDNRNSEEQPAKSHSIADIMQAIKLPGSLGNAPGSKPGEEDGWEEEQPAQPKQQSESAQIADVRQPAQEEDRKAAEQRQAEEARKREEQEEKAKAEREKLEREKRREAEAAKQRQEQEEARKAEELRKAEEANQKQEQEAKKREEQEAKTKVEQEKLEREQAEARKREEEQARLAREAEAKQRAKEEARKAEEQRKAEEANQKQEQEAKVKAEQDAKQREVEEAARKEAEDKKREADQREKAEQERLARERQKQAGEAQQRADEEARKAAAAAKQGEQTVQPQQAAPEIHGSQQDEFPPQEPERRSSRERRTSITPAFNATKASPSPEPATAPADNALLADLLSREDIQKQYERKKQSFVQRWFLWAKSERKEQIAAFQQVLNDAKQSLKNGSSPEDVAVDLHKTLKPLLEQVGNENRVTKTPSRLQSILQDYVSKLETAFPENPEMKNKVTGLKRK